MPAKFYRKIDIYALRVDPKGKTLWSYLRTTEQAKTCREAKEAFLKAHPFIASDDIKTRFSKG